MSLFAGRKVRLASLPCLLALAISAALFAAEGEAESSENPSPDTWQTSEDACASTEDSLKSYLLETLDMETNPDNFEFETVSALAIRGDSLKIGWLYQFDMKAFNHYYLIWKQGGEQCAALVFTTPPTSNHTEYSLEIEEFSPLVGFGDSVIQIVSGFSEGSRDYEAKDPENDLIFIKKKFLILARYNPFRGVEILASIPIWDSGDGSKLKRAPSFLVMKVQPDGYLMLSKGKGSSSLSKRQMELIGFRLLLSESGPSQASEIPAAHRLALPLFKQGRPGAAADTLAKAIPIANPLPPGTPIAMANDLGYFLVEAKRYAEGVTVLHAVLSRDPNRTVAYLNLGDAYAGLKKDAEAKSAYEEYTKRMQKAGRGKKIPTRIQAFLKGK